FRQVAGFGQPARAPPERGNKLRKGDAVRVLLVEDDDMVRQSLSLLPEDAGFWVAGATDGKEAVRSYRRTPADVILCDLFMPQRDGLEVIRELRREFPGVRIVAMSGGGFGGGMDM